MTQILLFDAPAPLEFTPGEINRRDARRRDDRRRQRLSRARKSWRLRILGTPLDQNARLAAKQRAFDVQRQAWSQEEFMRSVRAKNVLFGALLGAGAPARRAIELVSPHELFDEKLAAVWSAMAMLSARGSQINERTVRAQMKRRGIIALVRLTWLELPSMPRPEVTEVEAAVTILRIIAGAEVELWLEAA